MSSSLCALRNICRHLNNNNNNKVVFYIIRHQIGDANTNCLNEIGLEKTKQFAKKRCKDIGKIITCMPHLNGKHVRPLQTASMIGSIKALPITIYETVESFKHFKGHDKPVLIIWHHSEIEDIIKMLIPSVLLLEYDDNMIHFTWPQDNYNGCIKIYNDGKWTFDEQFT